MVALRKESVDRNPERFRNALKHLRSLSARRAWIEITVVATLATLVTASLSARRAWIEMVIRPAIDVFLAVALRKESVDRNPKIIVNLYGLTKSLSARRAWIEIAPRWRVSGCPLRRSPQGERG